MAPNYAGCIFIYTIQIYVILLAFKNTFIVVINLSHLYISIFTFLHLAESVPPDFHLLYIWG